MPDRPTTHPPHAADAVVRRFLAGDLDAPAWTHAAHLFVCRHVVAEAGSTPAALARLRVLIQAQNERAGLLPYHGGYHETITRYFVEAVAATAPTTTAELLAAPACQRDAPLRHWSPEVLGSPEARRTWVAPDRDALPWSTTT